MTMSENETVEFVKGSWQDNLNKSTILGERSEKAKKAAGVALWRGAQQAVETWLPTSTTDVGAEGLYAEVLEVMGTSRKGDVSKIKTVAVAVREHSLDLTQYKNLSGAYKEAVRLTKTEAEEQAEDNAAEEAVAAIEPPKSTSSVEGAAALLLSKGIDGAIVAILDALNGPSGENNEAAHRSFIRALASEVSDRVQAAKPKPEAKPKAEAKPKVTKASAPAATKTKAKPAPKAAPVEDEGVSEEDTPEDVADDVTPEVPVATKAKPRRRPVPSR